MSAITYTSPTERVNTWLDGSTLFIEFNNPARHNALSVDMWEAVPVLLAQAEQDRRVRLVVFQGAGEKAFVSGADISEFETQRSGEAATRHYNETSQRATRRLRDQRRHNAEQMLELRETGATEQAYRQTCEEVERNFAGFDVVPWTSVLERAAVRALEASPLRAGDALHIAAAVAAGVDHFITADQRQYQGALAVGLKATLLTD